MSGVNLNEAAGQLEDLHRHLTQAAAWCGADSADEAQSYLLDAFVTLGRLREALGIELKMVATFETVETDKAEQGGTDG